ncbi:MAG: cryptochrome/photolyase family protein, partial [Halioglobus sp.]
MTSPVIYWFRQDLRIDDLPGLNAAAASGQPVLPIFILDDEAPGAWPLGGASRWWLHHSLAALSGQLTSHGADLHLYRGKTADILPTLVEATGATAIFCSRAIEPWARNQEEQLHACFSERGVEVRRYPGALLFEPETIHTKAGEPFKVFTPFWRNCRTQPEPAMPRGLPEDAAFLELEKDRLELDALDLLPKEPDWAAGWEMLWQPGSEGAKAALSRFLQSAITDYDESRNHPARDATSRLSAHLHFGEISPRQVWHAATEHCRDNGDLESQCDKFLSELGWREFSHHLLHHFPDIPEEPFKQEFAGFPWLGS